MKKNKLISSYINLINNYNCIYLVDLSELTYDKVYDFRKKCYEKHIKLKFIKNTLFKKAIQNSNYKEFTPVIKGQTALMASNTDKNLAANAAIIINNFKKFYSLKKEYLKAAYIENKLYLGDKSLNYLINLKSKNDLLIEIFFLIKKNIINIIKNLKTMKEIKEIKNPDTAKAKIANLAKKLVNLTVTEVNELTIILKKDYGLEYYNDNSVKKITDSINQEQKKENRKYNVILKSSGPSKLAVVKLIKEITGRGLKDSKELVDSVPTTIKESINKEEAELFKKKFEEIGAEIELL